MDEVFSVYQMNKWTVTNASDTVMIVILLHHNTLRNCHHYGNNVLIAEKRMGPKRAKE